MKCPWCGSERVQLSQERGGNGCLWFLVFGWWYWVWVILKWVIGFMLLFYVDWWLAMIQGLRGRGYVWKCRRWFTGRTRLYYCHNCSHNFKG